MKKDRARLEGVGGGAFIDDDDAGIEVRRFRSGRGRIDGRRGRAASAGPEPEVVCGPGGRLGWRVCVPDSNRPLATPAVADGAVFLGAGFGSHGFHAFEADTGRALWSVRTSDDGPTAAVVADGLVAFNTESCTVFVVEAASGRTVWSRWLGDPLMAQPAIAGDLLFMAFPDRSMQHRLAALRLADGETVWEREISADVITAPVVAGDSVYASTLDGTVARFDLRTGAVHWSVDHRATSAPWVYDGRVFVSLRDPEAEGPSGGPVEGVDTMVIGTGARRSPRSGSRRRAAYLAQKAAFFEKFHGEHDGAVGFASAPAAAKLGAVKAHLGLGRVSSVWAYQGSRPAAFADGIFGTQGDAVQRLDLETKRPVWRCRLEFDREDALGQALSPPAVTRDRLYVTSAFGDLVVLDRSSGEELWALNVGAPVLSQPAVAGGMVYLGTAQGDLYAFECGDDDPTGWPMWGGGPGHIVE